MICPENTLAAFGSAVEAGADLVELDARPTRDDVLVVIHDDTLNRTTNARQLWGKGKHRVDEHDFADIATLDAGSWKDRDYASEHVPRLAEAVERINPQGRTLLERKSGSARAFAEYLLSSGQIDRIVVQSFDEEFLGAMHALIPDLQLAALGKGEVTPEVVEAICATGATTAAWKHKDLSTRSIALLRGAGLKVWAFTPNDRRHWRRLCRMGVEGIITDRPGACREWLEKSGRR